ncbi:MAG: hypothetical protein EPO16_02570, partial [Dehalococcoidia bacterium]
MAERRRSLVVVLAALVVAAGLVGLSARNGTELAEACAFDPRRPYAYEADQLRTLYLQGIDAASVNALVPGDPFFGLPPIERGART